MDLTIDELSVTDDLHFTPLHHIVIGLEVADLRQQLRISNAESYAPDSMGRSLLHWAVIIGNSNAVQALLEHGLSPKSLDKEQMTPLHDIYLCPTSSQVCCAQLLLKAGAHVDALDSWGRTPFRIAVGYQNISQELLELLIANRADVNRKDMYGSSPLFKSVRGSTETIRLLLDHGADIDERGQYGANPIVESIYRNKPEALKILLEKGAKTSEEFELQPGRCARSGATSLLDFIVWYGSVEVMHVMEKHSPRHYHLWHPLDTIERYRAFRVANGRKAGEEEQQAFSRMLSMMVISYGINLHHSLGQASDSNADEEAGDEEIFENACEFILEEV